MRPRVIYNSSQSGRFKIGKSNQMKKQLIGLFLLFLLSIETSFAGKALKLPIPEIDTSNSPTLLETDELYTERPNIDQVVAQAHSDLPNNWESQKEAHADTVAEILEMYPDWHLYFLARDGELLHDFAKIVLAQEPEQLERIHLLNVSRGNMRDENLLKYLAQEGISKENLENDMKVLLIDTGFGGTIPLAISERLTSEAKLPTEKLAQIRAHFMVSTTQAYPSTRVFLEHFHKGASKVLPSTLRSVIHAYESMPRFTHRSDKFKVSLDQKWVPTAPIRGTRLVSEDGEVNRELAQKYMEDLKHYALHNGMERFATQRSIWRGLRRLLDSDEKQALEIELRKLAHPASSHLRIRLMNLAIVRDFLEIVQRNEPTKIGSLPSLQSLGLPELVPHLQATSELNKK